MKPDNRFTNEEKTEWVNEIEGMIQQEALLEPPEIVYDWANDQDTELIIKHPHEKIYRHYLLAQLSYANEEYDRYTNEMQMFNSCWESFMVWICRAVRPAYRRRQWIPRVFTIVRGETVTISFFELPIEQENMKTCTISIWQGGEKVLSWELEKLSIEGDTASVQLTQAESLSLSEGTGKVTILVTSKDGDRYEQYPASRIKVAETTNGEVI